MLIPQGLPGEIEQVADARELEGVEGDGARMQDGGEPSTAASICGTMRGCTRRQPRDSPAVPGESGGDRVEDTGAGEATTISS